jgi:hypothetical protein
VALVAIRIVGAEESLDFASKTDAWQKHGVPDR